MARRNLQFDGFNGVCAELDRLRASGYERGGKWDLAQVCDHLAFFMRESLDGFTFRVPWLLKVLFGRFVLRRILNRRRMKDGAPTPQKPLPAAGGDEAAAVARLKQVIGRLQAHSGELRDSPFFGHLTPEQWRELHLIHCAHHLGFPATGATQNIDVEQSGSTIDVVVNGTTVASGPVSTTSQIDISGGASTGAINLTVDYSGGVFNTIPINFNGGTGGGATSLTIAGSTTLTSLTCDATGPGAGDFVVNGASADKITFSNVGTLIDSATVGTVTVNVDPADALPGTVNTTLTASGSNTIASFSSNSLASLTFPNPTAALIVNDTRTADDAVAINSLGSGFNAALTVTASGGSDTVTVTPALDLGSATSSGNLAITAATIDLNGGTIATNNGGADGSVTMTGAVTIGATLAVTASTVTFGGTIDAAAAGEQGLAITGNASFAGPIGGADPLASLSVSGTTALNTPSVATTSTAGGTGDQTYSGAVSLEQAAITLTATTVTFGDQLNLVTSTLTITGDLVLDATATLGSDLDGTNDYGQISCSGTAAIAGALSITQENGFTPPNGFVFDILGVTSSGALSGTFTGLPEGSEVFGGTFVITYKGGSLGDDVLLTAPIVVNTTSDPATPVPGTTSLREAIDLANGASGLSLITFALPGGGAQTLAPTSALPALTGSAIIDGTSEAGFAGTPLVILSGSSAGAGADGLILSGGGSSIRDLVIDGFSGAGVYVTGDNNLIEGNFIGTNAAATTAVANRIGLLISGANETVGGTTAGEGNVVSGNTTYGIELADSSATGTIVQGNFIGTDPTGASAIPNGTVGLGMMVAGNDNLIAGNDVGTAAVNNVDYGIRVSWTANTIGGATAGAGNLISNNGVAGVYLSGGGNLVQGNDVGINAAANGPLANGIGLVITGANETIGGTATGAGNVISGNTTYGIELEGSTATGTVVQGNFLGTDPTGAGAIPNGTAGVSVLNAASSNTIGAGNIISGNTKYGVYIATNNNEVQGNSIGINAVGTGPLENDVYGVWIASGTGNTIGGTASGAGNVISGNGNTGVMVAGNDNLIAGNDIGTNAAGSAAVPNSTYGFRVSGTANTIGGSTAGAGNLISGNGVAGLYLTGASNQVQGNDVGINAAANGALANGIGLLITGANETIGGTAAGAGNVVSGNTTYGIELDGGSATGAIVQGNFLGTDPTGAVAIPNGTAGLGVVSAAGNNTIGGTTTGAGNIISGNTEYGVYIATNDNLLQGNSIGINAAGTGALENRIYGVLIASGSGNAIGGTATGAGNVISGNGNSGVMVSGSSNLIKGNNLGTNPTGTAGVANVYGIRVSGNSSTIGGTATAAANLISGNSGAGVFLTGASNQVLGNLIGTTAGGASALANVTGVLVTGSDNTIGGTASAAGNLIADNSDDGVLIETGTGDTLATNSIYDNGRAIALSSGGNANQAAPTLSGASSASGTVSGTLTASASTQYRIEFFQNPTGNQAETYLGFVLVSTGTTGQASISAALAGLVKGQRVTATATSPSGSTSALSAAVTVS